MGLLRILAWQTTFERGPMMATPGFCPACGLKELASGARGHCPQCLFRLGLGAKLSANVDGNGDPDQTADLLGGIRNGMGVPLSNGVDGSHASGVLMALDRTIGPVPRVLLRDGPADARLVRPQSPKMPDLHGQRGRYH